MFLSEIKNNGFNYDYVSSTELDDTYQCEDVSVLKITKQVKELAIIDESDESTTNKKRVVPSTDNKKKQKKLFTKKKKVV